MTGKRKTNEMTSYDAARKPKMPPAPHPVIAEPQQMDPDKRRILQQATGDSFSAGWVHEKKGVK